MAATKYLTMFTLIGALVLGLAGCSSDDPAGPTGDTAPPAVPYNLFGGYSSGSGYVELSWDDNAVDADYAGVLISRTVQDQPAELLTETICTETTYRDYDPGIGVNVYSVVAVDENGNERAAATVIVVRPGVHAPAPDMN